MKVIIYKRTAKSEDRKFKYFTGYFSDIKPNAKDLIFINEEYYMVVRVLIDYKNNTVYAFVEETE